MKIWAIVSIITLLCGMGIIFYSVRAAFKDPIEMGFTVAIGIALVVIAGISILSELLVL